MLALLPALFFILCSILVRRYFFAESWRRSFLLAASITIAFLVWMSEILSLFKALDFYPVLIGWSLLTAAVAVAALPVLRRIAFKAPFSWGDFFLTEKILLGFIASIVAVTALTAIVSTPNTWDSMTYHLPRIEHWLQNKTLADYPSRIIRQLYVAPGAELVIAHLRLLGAPESAANLVQWLAMLGCLVAVSLIARQLGADRPAQLLASLAAASLPMGILQAVSTQTDYVAAFWLVNAVFFMIELRRCFAPVYTVAAGLSLGLALLAKGTSTIFIAPFAIWLLAGLAKSLRRRLLGAAGVFVACILLINAGYVFRNVQMFGSVTWTNVPLSNASFDAPVVWGNFLRNFGLHLSTPWDDVNRSVTQGITQAARFLGAEINDPRAVLEGNQFAVGPMTRDEDNAANALHTLIFSAVFILLWLWPRAGRGLRLYALMVLCAGLMFCAIVRWQPWHSRFHLPLFIVFCPLFGAVCGRVFKIHKAAFILMGSAFFLCSLPWLFDNSQHPWFGRLSIWKQPKLAQYFYKRPTLVQQYVPIAAAINAQGCRQIGLVLGEDDWEYPLWALLKLSRPGLRIEHVQVGNASQHLPYPLGPFSPCAVIAFNQPSASLALPSGLYIKVLSFPAPDGSTSSLFAPSF